jgi:hypothetical protein
MATEARLEMAVRVAREFAAVPVSEMTPLSAPLT